MASIGGALDSAAATDPKMHVLRAIPQGYRWNNSDLLKQSDALACGFVDLGYQTGDTVATVLPNNVENIVAQMAAAKAGLVLASIDAGASTAGIQKVLAETGAKAIIADPSLADLDALSGGALVLSTDKDSYSAGVLPFADVMVYGAMPCPLVSINASITDATAFSVSFNAEGASTGSATHGDALAASQAIVASAKLCNGAKVCAPTDAFHAVLAAVQSKAAVVIPGEDVAAAMASEGCTAQL
jgi:hypothetical protein